MLVWDIAVTDLLFPLAVVAIWAIIFLGVFFVSRWALHDHDAEAEAEARANETSSGSGPTMTPLSS